MRVIRRLGSAGVLAMLLCYSVALGQTAPAVPFISQVTPASIAPAPNSSLVVQFGLTILGANFPANSVVKLTLPEGPSLYAASASVNATGSQIVAQFNTTIPRPAVYAVTVSNAVNNPTAVSNIFYLPVTPPAATVGISQNTSQFLTGAPSAMATGDFNGDGNVDVAFVSQNTNTVSILLGTFGGTLSFGAAYPTGNRPSGIVAADFNGDGELDLAVTNSTDNTITILLGNGDGTFRPGTTINETGTYPTQIIAADLNGDGRMDLAALNVCGPVLISCFPSAGPSGPGAVLVLLGNGDGTFSVSASSPATGVSPSALAAADLNSDGAIDLVVTNQLDNNMTVLMGNGDGTFTPTQSSVVTGIGSSAMAIADFNGDGKLDVAVANSSNNKVSIFLNENCGFPAVACTFSAAPTSVAVGSSPYAISAGDMNADGFVDLVVANLSDNSISVLLGDGTGGFTAVVPQRPATFSTGFEPTAIALADFNGDGRLDVATANASGSYSILTQMAVPQVVLTIGNNFPTYGMNVTYMVNVNPSIATQPTGTVTLFDGTNSLGTVTLSGYQANFFISTPNVGTHQITATYNGDANFLASTSAAVTETVSQAQTNLTLGSNVNTLPYGQPFTLSATVVISNLGSPTGTVSFFDTSTSALLGTAPVTSGVAQLTLSTLTPGAHIITAWYTGDTNFLGSSSPTYTENILQASTTISVTSSPNPITLGQPTTLTATIQPGAGQTATGAVVFMDGPTLLGFTSVSNNSASFAVSNLSVGTHTITARYTGDTNFSGSTSAAIPETVNQGSASVTLGTSLNPSSYGQAITLGASLQPLSGAIPPTGTVNFQDGFTVLGVAPVANGSAQLTISSLLGGGHTITAKYSGDSNYQASVSSYILQNVNPATTSTTVTSSQNPSPFNQALSFTAAVQPAFGGSATGNVTFYDGATSLGSATPTNNAAQLTVASLSAGSHSITARYAGDTNTNVSVSAAVIESVTPATTTTTIASSLNPSAFGQAVTFVASWTPAAASVAGGMLSFYEDGTLLSSIPINAGPPQITLSNMPAGTHTLTAQFTPLSSNYAASTSAPLTQTVNQAASLILVSSGVNPSTFGQSVTLNASISTTGHFSSANNGTVTFLDNGASIGSVSLPGNTNYATLTTTALNTGTHSITVSYSGDANYAAGTSAAFTQTVNLEPTTTSIASSTYTPAFAQSITLTATVRPLSGTTATGTVTFLDRTTTIGTAALSGNSAQFAISTLGPGTHYISAQYSGDTNTATSTSGQTQVVVSPPPTTTLLTSSVNPSSMNQPVTFTATLQLTSSGTPTGTITFYLGSFSLGSVAVTNGSAQFADPGFQQIGPESITAVYSGDANFSGSTSAPLNQVVNPGVTTTNVFSGMNPGTVGFTLTFTVGVNATYGGAPPPMGTVTIYDGTTAIGSGFLSGTVNDAASISVTGLTAGAHSITARYPGAYNYAPSTSAVYTQVMNLPATTTYLSAGVNPAPYGQSLALVATVQPPGSGTATGTVTFFNGGTSLGTVTVSNNLAQLNVSTLPVGTDSLTAKYSGDANFAASTSTALTETVNPASTTTLISSSANPATYAQPVTLTASVAPAYGGSATGTIVFLDGTTALGTVAISSNAAQLTISNLTPGAHSITAKYSGDGNFTASTSSAFTETVNQATATTSVASNVNPATFGQSVVFTVTVQPSGAGTPTGTVTLMDGVASLAGTALSAAGNAQFTLNGLSAGSHSITAVYGGDANFAASTSAALGETVTAASTATAITSSANPSAFDQTVTLTAAVQPPVGVQAAGTVTFMDGATSLGSASLSSNSAQLTISALTVGTHSITAVYPGSANLSGSTSAALSQVVNGASTSTTLVSSTNPSTFGQSVTLTATIQTAFGGSASGTVTFLDGTTSLGAVGVSSNAAQLSLSGLSAGSHSITAKYNGDTNFSSGTSAAIAQTVNQASTTTTVASSTNPSAFGQTVTFTASVQSSSAGTPTGNVTFFDGGSSLGSASLSGSSAQLTVAALSLGSHSVTAKYNGDSNYTASLSAALAQSVVQSSSSITLTSNANPSSFGQAVTFTASVQPGYSGVPTGTVTFFDGVTSLGSISLSGVSAQLTLSSLSLGSHSITSKYNGDSNFTASTSTSIAQSVTQAATASNLGSSVNPSSYGQAVTFTANVAPAYSGTPTGTVSFFDGGVSLGSANLSGGVATFSVSATTFNAGSHSITAKYNGDSNFLASGSVGLVETVNPAATVTTIASSANPSAVGKSLTFTAHVSSAVGGSLTGTANFYLDGNTNAVASVSLSGGTAQYTTSSLSAGTHSLTAALVSSNGDFNGSTSTLLTQNITDFSISASPASQTIARGSSGAYTLTLSPIGGLTGSVSLSCSGAPGSTTCSLSPSPVTLNGTNSAQATVTVTVGKNAGRGTHTLTLKGTSGSVIHSTTVSLTIN
jgi:hypothetical protein